MTLSRETAWNGGRRLGEGFSEYRARAPGCRLNLCLMSRALKVAVWMKYMNWDIQRSTILEYPVESLMLQRQLPKEACAVTQHSQLWTTGAMVSSLLKFWTQSNTGMMGSYEIPAASNSSTFSVLMHAVPSILSASSLEPRSPSATKTERLLCQLGLTALAETTSCQSKY